MAEMIITAKGNDMSVNIGRLTVAYIDSKKQTRVIHNATGEVLREDPAEGNFSMKDFKQLVEKYQKMMVK